MDAGVKWSDLKVGDVLLDRQEDDEPPTFVVVRVTSRSVVMLDLKVGMVQSCLRDEGFIVEWGWGAMRS